MNSTTGTTVHMTICQETALPKDICCPHGCGKVGMNTTPRYNLTTITVPWNIAAVKYSNYAYIFPPPPKN